MHDLIGSILQIHDSTTPKSRILHPCELCTVRTLYTTDESRTYSGKRPIGINGVNIPVVNSDILNRAFIIEMQEVASESDGLTESQLIPENEI